jgi:hypothetical protein
MELMLTLHRMSSHQEYVALVNERLKNRAARTIQTKSLQVLAKMQVVTVKQLAVFQAERRRNQREDRAARRIQAAAFIQRVFRGYVARRVVRGMRRELAACVMIQRNWRAMREYRKIKFVNLVKGKKDQSASKVRAAVNRQSRVEARSSALAPE